MKKQTAISPFKRKGAKAAAEKVDSYEDLPSYADQVIDSAKETIYKYDSVVNEGRVPVENSHIMHFDPAESNSSTEQATRH